MQSDYEKFVENRKIKDPLVVLCFKIENGNNIHFDSPVSVEIEYCDSHGEITNRKIDIILANINDF
jgi:hypothetical protein